MQTKQIALITLAIGLNCCPNYAGGLTNNSTNQIKKIGDYSMMQGTNGHYIYVNPGEFWNGVWKQDTNGWKVQLRIYPETNSTFVQGHVYPVSTNLMLRVEWGSLVRNSGRGYFMAPNGKFAKFQLLDAKGNVVPPNPNAGTNLLGRVLKGRGFISFPDIHCRLVYETNLPVWVSPASGSLVANFPKTISTNVYPHLVCVGTAGVIDDGIAGETGSVTNRPPFYIGLLKLDEIYSVTNEGDYTLTVQPVLYKRQFPNSEFLDRVDLPCVTTKVHLVPNVK